MTQHTTRGRPEASGPPPSIGAILLRWLHQEDRTIAYLVVATAINPDELINIFTSAIAPTSEQLNALTEATGLDLQDLQQAAMDSPPDRLLAFTINQVAERLQVSDDTVRREMARGRLGYVTLGERTVRIPWSALEELLDWRDGGAA